MAERSAGSRNAPTVPDERRLARRLSLAFPVRFGGIRGTTRNVSSTGAYIEIATSSPFAMGDRVPLCIDASHCANRCESLVHGVGKVVRQERASGPLMQARRPWGIAVCFAERLSVAVA